jgi:hypothetical protein
MSGVFFVFCFLFFVCFLLFYSQVMMHVVALPHDYTMFYCLSVAMFYEGLMSATYHICPTRILFAIELILILHVLFFFK